MPSERLASQEQTKRNSVPHTSLDNQQQTEALADQTRSELEQEFLSEVKKIRPKNLRDILCLYFYTYVKPDKDLTESYLRKPRMMPGIRAIKNRLKCSDRKALDMLRTINVAHRFLSQENSMTPADELMQRARQAFEPVGCHECRLECLKKDMKRIDGQLYCPKCATLIRAARKEAKAAKVQSKLADKCELSSDKKDVISDVLHELPSTSQTEKILILPSNAGPIALSKQSLDWINEKKEKGQYSSFSDAIEQIIKEKMKAGTEQHDFS